MVLSKSVIVQGYRCLQDALLDPSDQVKPNIKPLVQLLDLLNIRIRIHITNVIWILLRHSLSFRFSEERTSVSRQREYVDRSQDSGKAQANYYRISAQCFNSAAELAMSCTMPRDASSTTRVFYTCSLKNFRFNEDFEMLHPAELIDPFKAWRDVIKYMLPFCQVRKKMKAAEKKFPAFSAGLTDQVVMAMDTCT